MRDNGPPHTLDHSTYLNYERRKRNSVGNTQKIAVAAAPLSPKKTFLAVYSTMYPTKKPELLLLIS